MSPMDWQEIKRLAEQDLRPVPGGYTKARRGIATLPDGRTVFVKIAVDDSTRKWITQEISTYLWLEKHGYEGAPKMLAHGEDGFALPDLSKWDWSKHWSEDKLRAILARLDELDGLTEEAKSAFVSVHNFGSNLWRKHDYAAKDYGWLKQHNASLYKQLRDMLSDPARIEKYAKLADSEPWKGNDFVHFDARSDNFGYNPETKTGLLIDWNWAGMGSKVFDRNSMLINVQKYGFNVLESYAGLLDAACLAWMIGFWLSFTCGEVKPDLIALRGHQVESLLVASNLLSSIL